LTWIQIILYSILFVRTKPWWLFWITLPEYCTFVWISDHALNTVQFHFWNVIDHSKSEQVLYLDVYWIFFIILTWLLELKPVMKSFGLRVIWFLLVKIGARLNFFPRADMQRYKSNLQVLFSIFLNENLSWISSKNSVIA
jgi:hypothetical protein